MDVEKLFDEIDGKPQELTEDNLIKFQNEWNLPLSDVEIDDLKKNDIKPSYWTDKTYGEWKPKKFEDWTFPKGNFPKEFIELIKGYSGCCFIKGEREFSIFAPNELRKMNIAYELPEYIDGAVSFGLDGSGNHIIFDMRPEDKDTEYKIYGVHSSYLEWEGAKLIANDFREFINGTENIDELVNG
ncbi:SMI1/KNR4 family protein [Rapidithrix thailandica]|uniref:SMI1/KNR4 family protein n=1 Tax=Rapidithrix thailandica TaxID=413964 RepID=A0AAW9S780_9BACT